MVAFTNAFFQKGTDEVVVTEAEVTSSPTSTTASPSSAPVMSTPTTKHSSFPRSKVLVSQTSVETPDRSDGKQSTEMNG